jgi:hypothetical protein
MTDYRPDLEGTQDMTVEVVKATVVHAGPHREMVLIVPREDDARIRRQALVQPIVRALNGDRAAYFKASFIGGRWKLGRRLPDQGW